MQLTDKIKKTIKKTGLITVYYKYNRRFVVKYNSILYRFSPELYAKRRYNQLFGKKPDLQNPTTFNEKLIWLMLYWRHPLKVKCADKYTVRSYVEQVGLGNMLPDLLGVYEKSSEIDFDSLPEKFVLKCTHGCGYNIICKNKSELNIDDTRRRLDIWIKKDYSIFAGEVHYALIKPRIICERFLEEIDSELPIDYKVYCFNGKPRFTLVIQGRGKRGTGNFFDFYTLDWETKLPYFKSEHKPGKHLQKPEGYEIMLEAAKTLSKPFPFVRIDFYNIKGEIFLGEMTFTPAACMSTKYTDEAQTILGNQIVLPDPITISPKRFI